MRQTVKRWRIELVTQKVVVNNINIDAKLIAKIDYQTLIVDGVIWEVPGALDISFAEIECLDR